MTHTLEGDVCGKCRKAKHIIEIADGHEDMETKMDRFAEKIVESEYDETLRKLGEE